MVKRLASNIPNSKTLEGSLAQNQRVRELIGGTRPTIVSTDRGFSGISQVEGTQVLIPQNKKEKTRYKQQVAHSRFRARAAI